VIHLAPVNNELHLKDLQGISYWQTVQRDWGPCRPTCLFPDE